jgi:hypothetical protein
MISRFSRPLPRAAAAPKPAAIAPATPLPTVPVESIEYDEDGRRILTAPLAAPFRPVPTVMPPPASRLPPPQVSSRGPLLKGLPRPAPKPQPVVAPQVARPVPQPAPPGYPTNCRDAKAPYQPPRAPKPVRKQTFTAADVPFTLIGKTSR